jgi:hypothetical protein
MFYLLPKAAAVNLKGWPGSSVANQTPKRNHLRGSYKYVLIELPQKIPERVGLTSWGQVGKLEKLP